MTETRSKTWILIDNTIAILNRFDYIKVTVIKKSINSVKKIKDYTYQFTMQDKTVYLIEGITDIKTNHKNGSIKMPESLIDWNKSYIDN